jgi:hypothetical protein
MDMRFYWVRDRVCQKQFKIHWKKGSVNHADYFSKHHPAPHHRAVRSTFLYDPENSRRNHFAILQDAEDASANNNVSAIPVGGCDDLLGSKAPRLTTGLASIANIANPGSPESTVDS